MNASSVTYRATMLLATGDLRIHRLGIVCACACREATPSSWYAWHPSVRGRLRTEAPPACSVHLRVCASTRYTFLAAAPGRAPAGVRCLDRTFSTRTLPSVSCSIMLPITLSAVVLPQDCPARLISAREVTPLNQGRTSLHSPLVLRAWRRAGQLRQRQGSQKRAQRRVRRLEQRPCRRQTALYLGWLVEDSMRSLPFTLACRSAVNISLNASSSAMHVRIMSALVAASTSDSATSVLPVESFSLSSMEHCLGCRR